MPDPSTNPKDALILSLCEKLYICSRLLTRAAERLDWDSEEVQRLVFELRVSITISRAQQELEDLDAGIKAYNESQ